MIISGEPIQYKLLILYKCLQDFMVTLRQPQVMYYMTDQLAECMISTLLSHNKLSTAMQAVSILSSYRTISPDILITTYLANKYVTSSALWLPGKNNILTKLVWAQISSYVIKESINSCWPQHSKLSRYLKKINLSLWILQSVAGIDL